ncbi:MAG TPA: SDR family oxidoreductase [Dehalococcoidia bacterium]|nr:SDR family oxidoreductase [Dehalococcoidia bacterium]
MILDKYRLDGKVALITGGSRGIGQAVALGFAEVGADVAIASRKLPDLEEVAKEISALGRHSLAIAAHAGHKEELDDLVKKTIDEFGRIDILVNNAGTNPVFGPLVDIEERAWDALMNLNLKGYYLLSQAVAKLMMKQGGGSIINMASAAGTKPFPGTGAYSVSKAGVIMLTQVLATELGKHNIRVNAIAPGVIKTKMSTHLWSTPEIAQKFIEHTALGYIGQPEDIVGVAVLLASDASSYISGQTIAVDGGGLPFGR